MKSPIIERMDVIPVAGYDSMLMTLSGAHAPCFTRNLVILTDSAGHQGIGENPRRGLYPRWTGSHETVGGRNACGEIPGSDAADPSTVRAAVDFFGPVDVKTCNLIEIEKFKDPNHRWHKIEETHGGALLGGDPATMVERSDAASPIFHISDKTAPIMILHGDQDPLVPVSMSEDFYDRLVKAGLENQSELYIVKNGGHGTRELFQMECKEKILAFLRKYV